jgi:hypothetical protein
MTLSGIRQGDIILCDVRGRIFHAEALGRDDQGLHVRPLQPNITYRHVTARQITKHWRLSGRVRTTKSNQQPVAA